MAILEGVQRRASKIVFNVKTEKGLRYSIATLVIWALAIASMSILTMKDLVLLTNQYLFGQSIFNQEIIDASKDAINLPNMTICIRYYKQDKIEDVSFENFHYMNFSKFQLKQAFLFSQRISYVDYITNTLRNWNQTRKANTGNINDNDQSIYINFKNKNYNFSYTEENLHTYWNNLAYVICTNMNPRLNLVDGGRWKKIVDFCKEAKFGNLPIVPVDENTLCFRVPLELITIQENETNLEKLIDDVPENESILFGRPILFGKKIVFSFQPLVIRQLLFPDEKMEHIQTGYYYEGAHYKLVAFFPETQTSYSSIGFTIPDEKWRIKSKQYYREVYYKTSYARSVWLPIYISISKKETRLDDANCVDVYNETGCIIVCQEAEFANICKCRRFANRFYTQNSHLSSYPFCSLQNYYKCSESYKKYLMTKLNMNDNGEDLECHRKCAHCSKMKFVTDNDGDFFVDSVVPSFIRSKVFEQFFNTKLTVNETFKEKFFEPDLAKYNTSHTIMDDYVNEIVEFADKIGGSLKQEYYETLFGRVYFVITVNTNTFYPNIVETFFVTPDGYRSQIGGILGLYLGCSCITGFTVIIKILKHLKKRWRKSDEKRRSLSLQSTAILNLWRALGRHKETELTSVHVVETRL